MADVDEILDSVPETAGSYAPAAEALDTPINEGTFGDTQLNAEHVLGETGVRNLLEGKLSHGIVKAADSALEPEKAGVSGLGHVEKLVNKHSDAVENHVDGIFSDRIQKPDLSEPRQPEEHREIVDQINNLANNPSALIDKLSAATQTLHAVAPQIASNIQQTATRAIQFLASKVSEPEPDALGEKYEAPPTEIARFHRYMSVVESPKIALAQIREGTLTPETVETIQTVYPRLYDHMKQQMIARLDAATPYKTKIGVSMFLGEPLVSSLTPEQTQSMQRAFAGPQNPPPPGKSGKTSAKGLSKIDIAGRSSLTPKDS